MNHHALDRDRIALFAEEFGDPVDHFIEIPAVGPRELPGKATERTNRPYPDVSPVPVAPNMPRRVPITSGPLIGTRVGALAAPVDQCSPQQALEFDGGCDGQCGLFGFPDGLLAVHPERHLLNLVVQLQDCVQQHLRPRWAAG